MHYIFYGKVNQYCCICICIFVCVRERVRVCLPINVNHTYIYTFLATLNKNFVEAISIPCHMDAMQSFFYEDHMACGVKM